MILMYNFKYWIYFISTYWNYAKAFLTFESVWVFKKAKLKWGKLLMLSSCKFWIDGMGANANLQQFCIYTVPVNPKFTTWQWYQAFGLKKKSFGLHSQTSESVSGAAATYTYVSYNRKSIYVISSIVPTSWQSVLFSL